MVCAAALLATACGGEDDEPSLTASTTTVPSGGSTAPLEPGAAPLAEIDLTLTDVAEADAPTSLVARPGSTSVYVAEREGRVRALTDGTLGDPVLDISDDVVTDVEQGLLGIEFSPDGATL